MNKYVATLLVLGIGLEALAAESLQERLATAKSGETVMLPAGEFQGGATLPKDVSLRGAGVGTTLITGGGLTIEGGRGATISDLTVRGAGVIVTDAASVTLASVRVTDAATGFLLRDATSGHLENCISDHNNRGIAVSGGERCVVVNCTIAECAEVGLSLANCPQAIAFNNCLVGSATCLQIDRPDDLQIDHNLYFGIYTGQMNEQAPRRFPTAWSYLTGLDKHSVKLAVEFDEDFRPTTPLSWALDRAATAPWGVAEFAGVQAPESDLLGERRTARPSVGAVEAIIKPPRAPAGEFTVESDAGLKSAGIFTQDGFLVAYLFQNLPLPAGRYPFWLPPRDYLNRQFESGNYEVRIAESDFHWQYLSHIGDNGEDGALSRSAPHNPRFTTFTPGGLLVVQEGPSEDHAGIRAYDPATGKLRWWVNGTSEAQGVATGSDGTVYFMRETNPGKAESRLTRANGETGAIVPWPNSPVGHIATVTAGGAKSLTVLGDLLYLAAWSANKVFVISTTDGKVERSLDISAPRAVAGDEKNGLLWVVSGAALIALKPDGTRVAESTAVPEPLTLAAHDGQLAVASSQTGKIHFLDAGDPQQLKPLRELGSGDGPYGPFAPERFWFRKAPRWQSDEELTAGVALSPGGKTAVIDQRRVLMFDADGKSRWHLIGTFGNQSQPSYSTQNRRLWDSHCELSFWLDEKTGTWTTEGLWDHSRLPDPDGQGFMHVGDFADGGKTFLVTVSGAFGRNLAKPRLPLLVVSRLEQFQALPVLMVLEEGGQCIAREDTSGDGRFDAADRGQVLVGADGKPLPTNLFHRFNYLQPDGSLLAMGETPMLWKRTGLSASGVPVYEGKNYRSLLAKEWREDLSPYDLKPDYAKFYGSVGFVAAGMLSDGGSVVQVPVRGSGGTGLNNGAGTDLVGFSADGRRRWVHQLAEHKGIAGLGTADDITLTSVFYSCETIAVDGDGLGLGGFCEPRQLHYVGYWIDHPNLRLFKLPDGHVYATWGDNADGRHPWFQLENQSSLRRSRHPFRLEDELARELAALEAAPPAAAKKVPQPEVRIPRLPKPLPIDGELEKWRQANVKPMAVLGPPGSFRGPRDCSAVIRMAYEGQNLYFQVLEFDDVPMFYSMVYEDCVELAINGACGPGYQFICYKDAQGQDHVWRNRFFQGGSQRLIERQHAPRIVKVLPNAQDVPERKLLESLYGVDLAESKVVVTEFKLPIDKVTFAGAEQDVFELGPGKSFWIGYFIDDNDTPYTDQQRFISWPATFGMFNPPEDGARVICE